MFIEINKKLREYKDSIILKESLEDKLKKLEETLNLKKKEQRYLKSLLDKEEKSVKRLENLSIYKLIATVLRNKNRKIKKEEEDYIISKIQYEECLSMIHGYEKEYNSIKSRINSLGDIEDKYNKLLEDKYNLIRQDCVDNIKILQIEKDRNALMKEKIELDEAIREGRKCITLVNKIISNLESAEKFGTYDIIGGGFLSSTVKYSRIDDAENELRGLIYTIDKFKKEISDVKIMLPESILEIDKFTYTLDVIFDNVFSDISVQRKIKSSIKNIKNLKSKIVEVNYLLEDKNSDINDNISELNFKLSEIIENI
ncbi:MAG: hypothetical protein RR628_00705 [Clostridium sp.]|uniref:hypothetical protein n=1 Tax=Clostridium sp. TaxID=1506 RepID=UPI002FCAE692